MAERKARQPLASESSAPAHAWPGDSIGYLVWRSYLVFRRAFDDGLAELDVTMAQVGLAGELMVRGPRTVADLARVIGITPQGAALAVAHLRKIGWVTRARPGAAAGPSCSRSPTRGATATSRRPASSSRSTSPSPAA